MCSAPRPPRKCAQAVWKAGGTPDPGDAVFCPRVEAPAPRSRNDSGGCLPAFLRHPAHCGTRDTVPPPTACTASPASSPPACPGCATPTLCPQRRLRGRGGGWLLRDCSALGKLGREKERQDHWNDSGFLKQLSHNRGLSPGWGESKQDSLGVSGLKNRFLPRLPA